MINCLFLAIKLEICNSQLGMRFYKIKLVFSMRKHKNVGESKLVNSVLESLLDRLVLAHFVNDTESLF